MTMSSDLFLFLSKLRRIRWLLLSVYFTLLGYLIFSLITLLFCIESYRRCPPSARYMKRRGKLDYSFYLFLIFFGHWSKG
jgi:hypothetical protein